MIEWTDAAVTDFYHSGREIGRGGFGRVYVNETICPSVVIKYSRSRIECSKFASEYEIATHIEKAGFYDENASVVKVLAEVSNLKNITADETWCALVMQRIFRPVLEFGAENTLSYQLYLGNAAADPPHTSPGRGNYIGPTQAETLVGRSGVEALAASMGRLVGFMHYGARVDAGDMEYLLGSTAEEPGRLRVYAVDFDRVRQIDPVTVDVKDLEWSLAQESYFPSFDDLRLYKRFKKAYLKEAEVYGFLEKGKAVIDEYEEDLAL